MRLTHDAMLARYMLSAYFLLSVSVSFVVRLSDSGSAAEWLTCWTQAQKALGSNRSRDAVG